MKALRTLIFNVVLNPFVLLAVGLVVGGIGVALVLDSPSYAARRARAERLAPSGAAALADSAPGREVLLEGRISPRNPTLHRQFVAYVREEYRDEALDGASSQRWVEVERVTPPLLVSLAGGEARIANSTYAFDTTAVTVEEAAPTFTKGAVQSRGFVAGSPVLAIGRVAANGDVEAEFLYAGTRAEYVQELERVAARSLPAGLALLGAGLAGVAVGTWRLRGALREIAAEQAAGAAIAQAREQATARGRRRTKR